MAFLVACAVMSSMGQVITDNNSGSSNGVVAKPFRYINPLSVEDSRSIGDPFVLRFHGAYYLYLSGGLVWSSDDLVHWKHHQVSLPPGKPAVAPAAFEYGGFVYLTGNDTGLLRSRDPLGPYEYVGDFKDETGKTKLLFDPLVFIDDDDRVYMYYSGRSTNGIFGVELDRKNLTRFAAAPTHFFGFDSSHIWERFGSANSYSEVSWLEAPWMTKKNGTYYLQYSASGTYWTTYAVGLYTGKSPLGPFTYYTGSHILVQQKGLINGTGHHCIIQAPDGTLWALYTVLYRNWNRHPGTDRRIGMDPVGIDDQGNMFIKGPTETPQWAPGVKKHPWASNDSGSIPLSIDASYQVSSEGPGRNAPYAFDNNVRTWWEPAATATQPWLILDLGDATTEDPAQEFLIDSVRLLFLPPADAGPGTSDPYQYKIEVSRDGKTYETVLDKTKNNVFCTVEFNELTPVQGRFVKVSFTGWPKGVPPRVIECTIFGKPVTGQLPASSLPRSQVSQ